MHVCWTLNVQHDRHHSFNIRHAERASLRFLHFITYSIIQSFKNSRYAEFAGARSRQHRRQLLRFAARLYRRRFFAITYSICSSYFLKLWSPQFPQFPQIMIASISSIYGSLNFLESCIHQSFWKFDKAENEKHYLTRTKFKKLIQRFLENIFSFGMNTSIK